MATDRVSEVVEPGVTAFHGERIFTLGLYHVRSVADIDQLADAGFNAAEVIYEKDAELFEAILDRAAERGVAVIGACRSEDVVAELLVDRYKDHKAVFMWNIEDDHDDEAWRNFEEVKAKAAKLAAADPGRIGYASATGYFKSRRDRAAEWLSFVDVPGIQSYPITPLKTYSPVTEGANALLDNYEKIRIYVDAAPGKPVLANLQTFPWHEGGRMPTLREIRAMTYGALVAGVDGILYYEIRPLKDDKTYWNGIAKLVGEIRQIEDALLSVPMQMLDTRSDAAVASAWTGEGDRGVLIVTNIRESGTGVSVELPMGFTEAVPAFPGVDDSLISNGERLAGYMSPGSAQVYFISRAP